VEPFGSVLHSCFSRSWGGLELYAVDLVGLLRDRGHAVTLACPPGSRVEREARDRGIAVVPLDAHGYVHPLLVVRLSRLLRRLGTLLVHAHVSRDLATLVPALQLARSDAPLVLTKSVGSYIMKRDPFHRYTYARVTRVLAISEVIRRNVLETTPLGPGQVVTVHFPVDTERFRPDPERRRAVRGAIGIDADETVIGFVGRFSPGKGHEDLLHAVADLRTRHSVRVLVVGEASYGEEAYEATVRRLADALGLGGVVTFLGFRRDVEAVLDACDLFAFPSHAEAFGMALVEAMAMELPVVSTNCDGVLDIVVDGETGLFVNPRRPDELSTALDRLLADPALRLRMGTAGRTRVLTLFDRRAHLARMEEIYGELLQERHVPRSSGRPVEPPTVR